MKKLINAVCVSFLLFAGAALAGSINVNTADAGALAEQLDGVGASRAEAIVAYREAHGEFDNLEDLLKVKGIGKAIVEKNADRIRFEEEGESGE